MISSYSLKSHPILDKILVATGELRAEQCGPAADEETAGRAVDGPRAKRLMEKASGLNRKYHTNGPEAHQFPLAYGPEAIAEKTLLFFGSGYARLAQCYTGFPALRPTMSTPTKATKPKAKNPASSP